MHPQLSPPNIASESHQEVQAFWEQAAYSPCLVPLINTSLTPRCCISELALPHQMSRLKFLLVTVLLPINTCHIISLSSEDSFHVVYAIGVYTTFYSFAVMSWGSEGKKMAYCKKPKMTILKVAREKIQITSKRNRNS